MLSNENIVKHLNTKFIGRNIIVKDITQSTNDDILRLAKTDENAAEGTIVIANAQAGGKGRRGRIWASPVGSVSMSILLKPNIPIEIAPRLTLLAAFAVADACLTVTGCADKISIKWPNDVLLNKKKFCGILTEMSVAYSKIKFIVLGIGLNVNITEIPEHLVDIATSLQIESGQTFSLSQMTAAVLNRIEAFYLNFLKRGDLSNIVDRYNNLLINSNSVVRVLDPKREYEGVALGINEFGELLVKTENKVEHIMSGEVSVRGVYGYV